MVHLSCSHFFCTKLRGHPAAHAKSSAFGPFSSWHILPRIKAFLIEGIRMEEAIITRRVWQLAEAVIELMKGC